MCGMKAAYIEALGDADSIRYGELPDPAAGPGQVLVRVQAVAVNSVDTFLRSGRWPTEVSFPLAIGRDLVGRVEAIGPGVTDVQPGELAWTNSAGYGGRPGATAELVAVERERLYPVPAGADPVKFIAAVHPGATAHGALLGRARLAGGERVAVVGANGAVGMCVVQAAASAGAEVIAVVREPRATERLRELGAAHIVIAEAGDAPRAAGEAARGAPREAAGEAARGAAREAAGAAVGEPVGGAARVPAGEAARAGLDVFLDATGQVELGTVPAWLNPRGRILVIAGRGRAELDLWPFYVREGQLLGFVMSAMSAPELAEAAAWINATYPSRPLTVSVGRVLHFRDAARAPDGLLLRRWRVSDAEALSRAVAESADHLRPWMAWLAEEPVPVERRRAMIEEWERDWSRGGDVVLGVFVGGLVAGGCGLHRRIGPHGLEIGYWIHPAYLRRGLATRAAALLTDAAFALPPISHVEIHHDKANQASAGIPRKLGYRWVGESPDGAQAPLEAGLEWRWRMERSTWEARARND
jgi:NADPH2:quinone reductase